MYAVNDYNQLFVYSEHATKYNKLYQTHSANQHSTATL